jgi:excisionase family DNA binding protein
MSKRWTAEKVIPEVDKSEKFLTVFEVASLLSVRPSTVYRWVSLKEIPHYKLGRIVRFKRKDLEAWVEGFRKERVDQERTARKILRAISRETQDIDHIIKKSIAETKGLKYTPSQEKPGRVKSLREEVEHGAI